jgi:hypothetical protein
MRDGAACDRSRNETGLYLGDVADTLRKARSARSGSYNANEITPAKYPTDAHAKATGVCGELLPHLSDGCLLVSLP